MIMQKNVLFVIDTLGVREPRKSCLHNKMQKSFGFVCVPFYDMGESKYEIILIVT